MADGRLSGTRREKERVSTLAIWPIGAFEHVGLCTRFIINARLEFPWKRHVGTMRFHVSPICATTLLFREGRRGREREREEREGGEHIPGGGRPLFR